LRSVAAISIHPSMNPSRPEHAAHFRQNDDVSTI
jgi:hypothetical protein